MEEISPSLRCSFHAKYHSDYRSTLLYNGPLHHHHFEQNQESSSGLYCRFAWIELASDAVLRSKVTAIQDLVVPHHVHH